MSTPTPLTDRAALIRNRNRISDDALFLHDEAMLSLQDRLSLVNRTFTNPAVVTGFPRKWSGFLPDARIVPDDDVLDLEPRAHDLVIHAMGLHWANDPVGQLIQCRRALKPDGLFLGVMFGGDSLNELRSALAEAEARITGGLSPRVAPMAEIRDLGGLMQRAGFALPVADSERLTVGYGDFFKLLAELRAMGEGNALTSRLRHPTRRRVLLEAARTYADHYQNEAGQLIATAEMIFLTGWAPDESQPKPLRPGSAVQRLADALGAQETKLKD